MHLISAVLFCLLTGSCLALAQDSTLSDPLVPGRRTSPGEIGVIFGPSFHMQDGILETNCGQFSEGAHTGYVVGVMLRRRIGTSPFAYGLRAAYERRNVSAIYNEYEIIDDIPSSTPGQTLKESILFRNEADIDFSVLSFTPFVEWSPAWQSFVHLGLMPQLVLSSHIRHTKKAAQETVTLDDGQVVYISFTEDNPAQATLQDGELPDVPSFQLGLAGGIGIDIRISKQIMITPLYQYVVPLTALSESRDGRSFKIRASQLLIAASIEL